MESGSQWNMHYVGKCVPLAQASLKEGQDSNCPEPGLYIQIAPWSHCVAHSIVPGFGGLSSDGLVSLAHMVPGISSTQNAFQVG